MVSPSYPYAENRRDADVPSENLSKEDFDYVPYRKITGSYPGRCDRDSC